MPIKIALFEARRCITAYTMVINPVSPIKLIQRPIGPNGPRGFGITARRFIQKGEYLYELPGMIAKTSRPNIQSNLSVIIPHTRQEQGSEGRVLFGPLRFVNHLCEGSNVTASLQFFLVFISYKFTLISSSGRPLTSPVDPQPWH